ncbi:MAG: M50 family metallopeptidase [Chloroflexota bacterium]
MTIGKPGRAARFFFSWFEFLWRWGFRILTYGLLLSIVFNWSWLSIQLFLAPPSSLVRKIGWLIVALILMQIMASLIHELGHLLVGYWVGLRLHLFIIGPLQIINERGQLHFRVRRGLGIFNGLTASLPVSEENIRRKMLWFAFGGPLASLIMACASGGLFFWVVQNQNWYDRLAWPWELILILGAFSFATFLSTLRPGIYPNGFPTDGGRILILLKNRERAVGWCAQVLLNKADMAGQRPSTWESHLIEQTTIEQEHSLDALMGQLLAYYWALDRGDLSRAEQHLLAANRERFYVSGGFKLKVMFECAYFYARFKQDLDEAEKWLAFVRRPHPQLRAQFYRAKTAVSLLNNNLNEAREYWELAHQSYTAVEQKNGVWYAEMDWMEELRELISGQD